MLAQKNETDRSDRRNPQIEDILMMFRLGASIEHIANKLLMDSDGVISVLRSTPLVKYLPH